MAKMAKYIRACGQNKPRLKISSHLVLEDSLDLFSLNDLANLSQLHNILIETHEILLEHITKECQVTLQVMLLFVYL